MSLSVDGVWKAGVWATTVWANGVWREGAAPVVVADIEEMDGGGKKKRRQSIYDDLPDYRLAPQPRTEYVPPVPETKKQAEKYLKPERQNQTSMAVAFEKVGIKSEQISKEPGRSRRIRAIMLLLDY